jgi:hypothetical protein
LSTSDSLAATFSAFLSNNDLFSHPSKARVFAVLQFNLCHRWRPDVAAASSLQSRDLDCLTVPSSFHASVAKQVLNYAAKDILDVITIKRKVLATFQN